MKKFEYSLLGSELKKQTDIAKKILNIGQGLNRIRKKGTKNNQNLQKYDKSDLRYDSKWIKVFLSANFVNDLDKLSRVKSQKENTIKKKKICMIKL